MLLRGFLSAITGKARHRPVKLKNIQPICILMCLLTAHAAKFDFKAVFSAPCVDIMTLSTPVPEMTEFTVCTYIQLDSSDPWTAFTYQLPTSPTNSYEFGLLGDSSSMKIWMFGTEITVFERLKAHTWYEVCIMWDGSNDSMGFYLDGTLKESRKLENSTKLDGGGSVVLGCSHFKDINASASVGLVGNIYMFRMWDRAQTSLFQKCVDGKVIKWRKEDWIYISTVVQTDSSLHCAKGTDPSTSVSGSTTSVPPISPPNTPTTVVSGIVTGGTGVNTRETKTLTTGSNTFLETTNITNVTEFTIGTSKSSTLWTSSLNTIVTNGSSSWSSGVTSQHTYLTSEFSQITTESMNCSFNDTEAFQNWHSDICNTSCDYGSAYEIILQKDCALAEHTLKNLFLKNTSITFIVNNNCSVLALGLNDTVLDICSTLNNPVIIQYILSLKTLDYYCCCLEECSIPNCVDSTLTCPPGGSVTTGVKSTTFNNTGLTIATTFMNGSGTTVYSGPSATFTKGSSATFNSGPITAFNNATITSEVTLTVNSKSKTTLNSGGKSTDSGSSATVNHGTAVTSNNETSTRGERGTMATGISEAANNASLTTGNIGPIATVIRGTANDSLLTTLNNGFNTTSNSGHLTTIDSGTHTTVNNSLTTLNNGFNTTSNSGRLTTIDSGNRTTVKNNSLTTLNNGFNTTSNSGRLTTIDSGTHTTVNDNPLTTLNNVFNTTARGEPARTTNSGSNSTTNRTPKTTITDGYNTTSHSGPRRTSTHNTTDNTGYTTTFHSGSETTSSNSQTVTITNGSVTSDETTTSTNITDDLKILAALLSSSNLNSSTVAYIVSKLEKHLSGEVSPHDAEALLNILSTFLNISQALLGPVSNRLIRMVNKIALQLTFPGKCLSLTSQSLALAVNKVNVSSFIGTSFSVNSSSGLQVSLGSQAPANSDGSVLLPASLINDLSPGDKKNASRVQFNYYAKTSFFKDSSLTTNQQLVSKVISSSVANLSVTNLSENITVTLKTSPRNGTEKVDCVFWDFNQNNGSGGWSSYGCVVANTTQNETVCQCNHMTSFAILMNVSPNDQLNPQDLLVLTFITYIGCGLSAIFLSVTLITYIAFEKIRRDYPSKILIQLCAALVCLNLTFLLNPWIALYNDVPGLCISVAAFLHYFVLVSITWMGLEAFHMYLSLVKVFNTYVRKYILKFCIVGWGAPAVVVAIILAVKKDAYYLQISGKYPNGSADYFCWVEDIVFWITVVGYFAIIFLLNVSMFVVVLIQLCRIKKQKQLGYQRKTTLQDMRSVAGITFLLGITWGFGFFSFGPGRTVIMYLFTIFNSLQGFFIFLFYCVAKENVRKQWRRYLCCGKFRLAENSDWSKTATNKLRKQTSKQGVSSSSSNSIQSTSNTNSTTLLVANEYSVHPNGNGNVYKERNGVSFKLENGEMPLQEFSGRPSIKNGDVHQNALRRTSNRGSVHFIDQI
ncbi:adhesion G-protein coupled receptor G2 isoform X3 [Bufo gargarizans]|uniref:adhesion G-protein coupled receptor G2 isoform X3 n=1 Tax=Bufo gargarizans TaxID=30331 RepID=UPI001CF2FF0F|nr:adhesion G-protein coupled receptor G2 isoform X3 [Bufo gargarizans]